MKTYRIAVLPGDGIGKEVVPVGVQVLQAVVEKLGTFSLAFESFPWGCEYYLETGEVMPGDAIECLRSFDAILFGAAGHPKVPDYLSAWRMIMVIRQNFDQYVNLRPVKLFHGIATPLANRRPEEIDFAIVRENTEGEFAGPGGLVHPGQQNEIAIQSSVFTRQGVERVARFAFELARKRRNKVTNVTKSNALQHGLGFWDRVVNEVRRGYPDVAYDMLYVDAAAMRMVLDPKAFDVILTTNMFGDILSDLGGAIMGGIGLGASANLDPEHRYPSMFEPIHGSAPDIAGKNLANPVGTIWASGLLLEHMGEIQGARLIFQSIEAALASGARTHDLGGSMNSQEMGASIIACIQIPI
jgi:tartrate dehydrogenase/decarboxylase/D-malate dehydrogenase